MAAKRSAALALVVIVMTAAFFRVWGVWFGLPHLLAHPDEGRVAQASVGFLSGRLHPGFFNYPSLYMYAVGLLDAFYCGGAVVWGRFPSLGACAARWSSAGEPFILTGRFLSVAAGTASVAILHAITLHLFDRPTALVSAALLAVTFLHVRDSHFAVTDVSMTALLLLALAVLTGVRAQGSARRFAFAGLLAGLATSTKYNGVLMLVPAIVSAFQPGVRAAPGRLAAFGAAMAGGFLLGTPYAVLDPQRFWADFTEEAQHLTAGHGIVLGIGWWHHLTVNLWYGMTWPLLACGLVGVALMIRRAPRAAVLLLSFPVVYYAVAGRGYTVFARYMIPVVPFLCISGAFAIVSMCRRFATVLRWRAVTPTLAIVTLLVATPSAIKSWELDRLFGRTDSRVLAAEWIAAHVPEGATIYQTGSHYGRPDLSRRGNLSPYSVLTYDESARTFRTPSGDPIVGPDWLVVQEHPLVIYGRIPEVIRAALPKYALRQAFRAIDMQTWHVFDQQDAFYVPLGGFAGVERPGPNLYVYERTR